MSGKSIATFCEGFKGYEYKRQDTDAHGGKLFLPFRRKFSALRLISSSRACNSRSRRLSSSKRFACEVFGGSSKGFVSSEWVEAKGLAMVKP